MELIYLWIEDYRSIRQQNINLTDRYTIQYNTKDSILEICDNVNFIEGFFREGIGNITAIVGENGTGKTSILDFVKDRLSISDEYYKHKLIFVLRNSSNNECIVYLHNADENKFKVNDLRLKKSNFTKKDLKFVQHDRLKKGEAEKKSIFESVPEFSQSKIIFYSNIFDYREESDSELVVNCSTNFLVKNEPQKIRYFEIKSQVDYIINNDSHRLGLNLPKALQLVFPKQLAIVMGNGRNVGSRNIVFIDNDGPTPLGKFIRSVARDGNGRHFGPKWKNDLIYSLLYNYLVDSLPFRGSIRDNREISILNFHLKSPFFTINNFHEYIFYVIDAYAEYGYTLFRNEFISDYEFTQLLSFKDNLTEVINFLLNLDAESIDSRGKYRIELSLESNNTSSISRFISSYAKSFRSKSVLDFDWIDMSSGEKARLSFLARLYAVAQSEAFKSPTRREIKHILFLIDEGEQYLHPQWQKEYIQFLNEYIPELFPDIKVQIILTSHSPFVLSDLTKNHVVYLAKDHKNERKTLVISSEEKAQTFAANIHLLFTDAYFMRNGLIGQFAQNKLDEILAPLIDSELSKSNSEMIRKFIEIIGEPVIKNKLKSMFEEQAYKIKS